MIRGAPMVLLRLSGPFFYHDQDRGFPRKHPRSCSIGRCAALSQLQKKLTPRRKAQRRIGKGWAPTNNAKMLGRRRQKTDCSSPVFPYLFARLLRLGVRSSVLGKTLLGAIDSLSLCQHRSRALAQHRSSPTAVGRILEAGRKAGQPPRPDRRPRSMIVPLQKILIADSFPSRADRRSPNPPLEYPV